MADAAGVTLHGHGDHAADVGVGLRQRHAGLQPGHALVAEVAQEELGPVEAEGQVEGGVVGQEAHVRGHDADDLPGGPVHGEGLAQDLASPPKRVCQYS